MKKIIILILGLTSCNAPLIIDNEVIVTGIKSDYTDADKIFYEMSVATQVDNTIILRQYNKFDFVVGDTLKFVKK